MKTGLMSRTIWNKWIIEIVQLIYAGRDLLQGTDAMTAQYMQSKPSRNSTYSNLQVGEKQASKQTKQTNTKP
jgi:hypothetical protein